MASDARYPTDHEPAVEVRAATGRFADFATVVGPRRADVRGCWCTSYRDSRVPWHERADYMRGLCDDDPGPGVLVYVDDAVAGWCSIAPRSSYRRLLNSRTIPVPDGGDPWVAICFVVRAGFRRHGLMRQLLDGAVRHAEAHGAEAVEGYPVDGPVDVVSGYVGSVELFERAGFERVAQTKGHSGGRPRWVMRKVLRL